MAFAIIFDSVGVGEWCVLLAVVLIVVGPKRLPSTARKFGQYYSKFRRAADAFKRQLMEMDTELSNTVSEATREFDQAAKDIEQAANDATSDLTGDTGTEPTASDPAAGEYGGYGEYGDYGGYDPDGPSEEPAAPVEVAPSAESVKKPDLGGIKITVSPAPAKADGAGTGA